MHRNDFPRVSEQGIKQLLGGKLTSEGKKKSSESKQGQSGMGRAYSPIVTLLSQALDLTNVLDEYG